MDSTLNQPLVLARRPRFPWATVSIAFVTGTLGLMTGVCLMLGLGVVGWYAYSYYYAGFFGAMDGLTTTGGGTIAYGDSETAEMPTLAEAHNWEFQGEAGDSVEIEVTGYGSDPYIRLIGTDGSVIAQNDDSGGTLNSYILATLPASGTYTIRISVWTTGRYHLTLEQ